MLGACITTAGSLTFLAHHHEGPRIPQKSEEIVNTTQVPYSSDVPSGGEEITSKLLSFNDFNSSLIKVIFFVMFRIEQVI